MEQKRTSPQGLQVALQADPGYWRGKPKVDKIIENTPNEARYYVGYVEWRPGELRTELNRGLWFITTANIDSVFRKNVDTMWEELQRNARAVSADAAPVIDVRALPEMLAAATR